MGPRDGLDGCGQSRPHRDLISGPSSLSTVAIPTELSGPTRSEVEDVKNWKINLEKFNFDGLYCIILLPRTVLKT